MTVTPSTPVEHIRQCAAAEKDNVKCHYCHKTNDLRPYGPRGAWVCFDCAMNTPDRKRETERNFHAQIEACGPTVFIDGSNVGPYPVQHHPEVAEILRRLRFKP